MSCKPWERTAKASCRVQRPEGGKKAKCAQPSVCSQSSWHSRASFVRRGASFSISGNQAQPASAHSGVVVEVDVDVTVVDVDVVEVAVLVVVVHVDVFVLVIVVVLVSVVVAVLVSVIVLV